MNIINVFKSSEKNIDELVWKYEEKINLYNKYSQFLVSKDSIITENITINQEPVVEELVFKEPVVERVVVIPITENVKQNVKENVKQNVKQNVKNKKILPIELIIMLTDNSELNREYVKKKLIETISLKSYIKVFGLKKSSEIMNGIIANKWNKSLVLFVSFLLDKTFIYLNKEVTFTKEANEYEKILL